MPNNGSMLNQLCLLFGLHGIKWLIIKDEQQQNQPRVCLHLSAVLKYCWARAERHLLHILQG